MGGAYFLMVFFMYPPVLGREGCKNTPPAGSDFALRASQGQSRIFAPLTPFSMYDSYEAPYENTALMINEKGRMPFSKRLCLFLL